MVRIISISDEVYDELSMIKGERSFTKVIKALLETRAKKGGNQKGLEKFFGIIDEKTGKAWMDQVDSGRKKFGKSRR